MEMTVIQPNYQSEVLKLFAKNQQKMIKRSNDTHAMVRISFENGNTASPRLHLDNCHVIYYTTIPWSRILTFHRRRKWDCNTLSTMFRGVAVWWLHCNLVEVQCYLFNIFFQLAPCETVTVEISFIHVISSSIDPPKKLILELTTTKRERIRASLKGRVSNSDCSIAPSTAMTHHCTGCTLL